MPTDYSLSPDLLAEQEAAKQQEALAQILAGRSMQPVTSSNPLSPVSPLQGVAQMIMARKAGNMLNTAQEQRVKLAQDYNRQLTEGVQDYARARFGTGVTPDPQEVAQSADYGTPPPASATGDPRAAMISALTSRNPMVRQLGLLDYQHELKNRDPYTLDEGGMRVTPGGPTVVNPKGSVKAIPDNWQSMLPQGAKRQPNDPPGMFRLAGPDGQEDVYSMEFDRGSLSGYKRLDNGPIIRLPGQPQPVTLSTIEDPFDSNKTIVVDARKFNLDKYKAGDKTGYVGPGPKLTEPGKLEVKRRFNMQGIGTTLDEARNLLSGTAKDAQGNPLPKPTGSTIGSVIDSAGAVFGMSPSGAAEADKLRALGGALTAKMPRMEGPQSDKDTQLYKEMAAQIGNDKIPAERRLAALDTVEGLWRKYEKLNPDAFEDRRASSGGMPGLPTPAEIQAELARRRGAKR